MAEPLSIVLATDDGFAMPTATAIASLAASAAPGRLLDIYVLDGGMAPAVARRLRKALEHTERSSERRNVRVRSRILTAELSATEALPRHRRISRSTYLRLLVGDLLPKEVSRALYVDGDTLILRDLAALFAFDLGEAPAGAAVSAGSPKYGNGRRPWAQLGIDPETPYVNAGVLLIDLERWRAENIGRAVLVDVAEHQSLYRWMDQDALNSVLANRWALLPPEWNLQLGSKACRRNPPSPETIGICHFTGIFKPWKPDYARSFTLGAEDPGFRTAWLQAARKSGWFTRKEWAAFRAALFLRRLVAPMAALARRVRAFGRRPALALRRTGRKVVQFFAEP